MHDKQAGCKPNLFDRMSKALAGSTNPYARKDLRKANGSTKFIGRGSPASSTNRYMLAAGDLANSGRYAAADIVFVSAEGARRCRIVADIAELWSAAEAGVTFVTDNEFDRNRAYNVGEREVAALLRTWGYQDKGSGCWRPQHAA
jgi:hypothetical protein